jgi:hypothetical protein
MLRKPQFNAFFSPAKAFLAAWLAWVIEVDQGQKHQKEGLFGGGAGLLLWLLLTSGLHSLSPFVSVCHRWLYEYRFDEPNRQVVQSTPSPTSQKTVKKTTKRPGASRKKRGLK